MKQKDIVLIIVIVFLSGIISLVVSNMLISTPDNRSRDVEVVDAIKSDIITPSDKYFNKQSIDPTRLIQIGDGSNPDPI